MEEIQKRLSGEWVHLQMEGMGNPKQGNGRVDPEYKV